MAHPLLRRLRALGDHALRRKYERVRRRNPYIVGTRARRPAWATACNGASAGLIGSGQTIAFDPAHPTQRCQEQFPTAWNHSKSYTPWGDQLRRVRASAATGRRRRTSLYQGLLFLETHRRVRPYRTLHLRGKTVRHQQPRLATGAIKTPTRRFPITALMRIRANTKLAISSRST